MDGTRRIVFSALDEVTYGAPAAGALAAAAERLDKRRVFLLVSATLDRMTDEIARIREALGPRFAGQFAGVPAHTPRAAVIEAAAMARAAGADLLATVGGGSVTDAGKAVQLCLANDIREAAAMDALAARSGDAGHRLRPPGVRQVAVPTTLSGGEFSAIAGVTDEARRTKELLRHPLAVPQAVILDPALTVHTPEWLWLSTGIRAVDHCVEGLCSAEANPYGDALAFKGLQLLARGLPRVRADARDLDARLDCQLGTWMAMGPLSSGVPMGASHGIGYVLGALHDVPHGYTSCVMLPAVMRWNRPADGGRQALVAEAMGRPGEDAGDVLDAFISGLGLPRSLAAVGVGAADLPAIADRAMATPWVPRNPRPISGPADVLEILDAALGDRGA